MKKELVNGHWQNVHICKGCKVKFKGEKKLKYCSRLCAIKHRSKNHLFNRSRFIFKSARIKRILRKQNLLIEHRDNQPKREHVLYSQNYNLERTYGINSNVYESMLEEQDYKCAICGKDRSELNKALAVDHNHSTKQIRGLLCNNCNSGIGMFKEDIISLQNAIKYLEKHLMA